MTLLRIEGGGHTWPGGDTPLPEPLIGRATQHWDGAVIWEFLSRFER